MSDSNETHLHFHIHEGASPEAVRAAVEAIHVKSPHQTDQAARNGQAAQPEADTAKLADYVARAYNDSHATARPLLEFLADNPERLIPFTEISAHLGYPTPRSLPGLLGSFGRRAKHRYEGNKPFEAIWENNQWHLRMPQANAEIINGLR